MNKPLFGTGLAVFAVIALALVANETHGGGLGGLAKSIRNLKASVPNVNPNPRPENKPEVKQQPKEEKFVELELKQFGVFLIRPDADVVKHFNLPADGGLMVSRVKEKSPAAKAGLKENDFLVELGGSMIPRDLAAFSKTVDALKDGAPVDVILLRGGKRETIKGLTPLAKGAQNAQTF